MLKRLAADDGSCIVCPYFTHHSGKLNLFQYLE